MNFGDAIANDFKLVVDQLEPITVTLNRGNAGGTGTTETVSIASANRSVMTRRMAAYSNVQLEDDDIPWQFPANQFTPVSNPPEIRHKDFITDSNGIVFIVQRSMLQVFQTVWLVITRRKTP